MAQMSVQKCVDAGTAPTFSAANTNDAAAIGNGVNSYLHVKNGGGASITVTLQNFLTDPYNGDAIANHVVTVAAAAEARIPLRKSYDKGDGTGAQITYSAVTSVTSALVAMS